ncbi:MAG: hypothetical protein HW389_2705 [Bacteroidetes bacterium]|nr:hypothetical protein [Bacteroidota bacterium]
MAAVVNTRSSSSRELQVDYWLCCWFLVITSWLGFEYITLIQGASAAEEFLIYSKWILGVIVGILFFLIINAHVPLWLVGIWSKLIVALTTVFLVLLWIDLHLYELLRVHLGRALRVMYGGDYQVFRQSLFSINVSLPVLSLIAGLPLLAIPAGLLSVRLTSRLSALEPLVVRVRHLFAGLLVCACVQLFLQGASASIVRREIRSVEETTMPLGFSVFKTAPGAAAFGFRVTPRSEERLPSTPLLNRHFVDKKADIIVFIIESARADAITAEVTPNLDLLRKQCLPVRTAISCGNATQLGWFSLLTGNSPFRFGPTRENDRLWGSAPFKALKRLGYPIYAFASFGLDFYRLDRVAFGKNLELIDSIRDLKSFIGERDPFEADIAKIDVNVTDAVLDALPRPGKALGRCFLVFYNSTHQPYHLPSEWKGPFPDFSDRWDYLSMAKDAVQVRRMKNRYLNALHFVDSQIGRVIESLKVSGEFEKTLIAVVGDHGEEFMESGRIFHNSEVNRYQIEVPFLLKSPLRGPRTVHPNVACSMDLFPTILDAVGAHDLIEGYCDGRSLFRTEPLIAVSALANGDRDPNRFCLHNGGLKAYFRFAPADAPIWSRSKVWLEKIVHADETALALDSSKEEATLVREVFAPFARRFVVIE